MEKLHKKKTIAFFAVSSLVLLTAGYFFRFQYSVYGNQIKSITIGNYQVRAEIVQAQEKKELGLGGRKSLCTTCGMLFIFEKKDLYSFWMKGMEFPIDIVWIADEEVVHMERNISYIDQQKTYIPSRPASMILELPAGTCEREGIEIGSHVVLK